MHQTKRALFTQVGILLLLAFGCALFFIGCGSTGQGGRSPVLPFFVFNTSTNSIETKAAIISQVAVQKVLKKYPNATPKLQEAATDLQLIEESPVITVVQVQEIIDRLPPDTFDNPDAKLYIELGILWFADDAGQVGVQSTPQLRAAARGMRQGIEAVLNRQLKL